MRAMFSSPRYLLIGLLVILLLSWFLKQYEAHRLEHYSLEAEQTQAQLHRTAALASLWKGSNLSTQIDKIKKMLPDSYWKLYEKKPRLLRIGLQNLEGRQLNKILMKIGALPLRFEDLKIQKTGERYSMECLCKW